MTGQININ